MLADVIKIFEREYEKYGDELITDSYRPDDGDYVIVNMENFKMIETVKIKMDKKTREIDRSSPYFDFISPRDYLSKYIDSNKAIKNKNIHSNNYLTFFVKKENIHNGKITEEIIEEYYSILRNPISKYSNSQKAKKSYNSFEERYGKPDVEKIDAIEAWIKNNIFQLVDNGSKDKSYLKIFFQHDLDFYKTESERYIIVNIFNSNDYNVEIDDETYGLPNDNMGLNSKKPYLKNMSRKVSIPNLTSEKQVLAQKKFFDYLANQLSMNLTNIYIGENGIKSYPNNETLKEDFSGFFLRIKKGKEVEIHDFDVIGLYKSDIQPINFQNVLQVGNSDIEYHKIYKLDKLMSIINGVLFSKFLTSSFFTEAKDLNINDNNLKKNLLLTRTALFTWFYKGQSNNVWKVLKFSSLDLTKGAINNGYLKKASERFNLSCALKSYFEGGENMGDILMDVKDTVRVKINQKETGALENDREYYFAVGQLTNYFISLSKTKNKVHSLANPIINAKNDERIKGELKKLYKKYNYAISNSPIRFKNLYAMVCSYVPEKEVDEELIIAGYLHSNLIYESVNKGENKGE